MEVFHDVDVADDVYAISAPERGWQHRLPIKLVCFGDEGP
jgi:hypothetical protein